MKQPDIDYNHKLSARLLPVANELASRMQKASAPDEHVKVIDLTDVLTGQGNFIYFDYVNTPIVYGYSSAFSFQKQFADIAGGGDSQKEIYYFEMHAITRKSWDLDRYAVLAKTDPSGNRHIIAEVKDRPEDRPVSANGGIEFPCVRKPSGIKDLTEFFAGHMLETKDPKAATEGPVSVVKHLEGRQPSTQLLF